VLRGGLVLPQRRRKTHPSSNLDEYGELLAKVCIGVWVC
jgi:hypothetical protein